MSDIKKTTTNPPAAAAAPEPYMNPYVAGVLLGLALLGSFVFLGAGLGASGGIARLAAWAQALIDPERVRGSEYFGRWGDNPLSYYLVFMLLGVFLGGLFSAMAANRVAPSMERGAAYPAWRRGLNALAGGVLVGFASRVAQGCTSGQALSGGALLLTGSLIFMGCVFAGGYAAAWFFRRQWHD
jgi:uncharacterized membrane protein YedE/YeeE